LPGKTPQFISKNTNEKGQVDFGGHFSARVLEFKPRFTYYHLFTSVPFLFSTMFRLPAFLLTTLLITIAFVVHGQTILVSHDFNSADQGWTASSTGWVRGTSFTGNTGNHWRTNPYNDYSNNANSWVTSPVIDLSGYASLNFSLSVRYKTATYSEWFGLFVYNDGMNVEYSTNGGTTWQGLGSTGEGTNWYNDGNVTALGNGVNGWSGNNGGWQTASISLPASLINQSSVRFRVRFASGGSQTDDGVAFDNVVITGSDPISFAPADGNAPGGVATNLSLWLKADQEVKANNGIAYAWGDRSGNNNHAYQTTSNLKPQYFPDALNGNPVVYFEQGPYMDGASGFYTQQYFIVLDPNEIYNSTNAVGRILGFQPGGFGHLAFGPSTTYSETEIITHAVDYTEGYRSFQEDNVSNYGNPSMIVSQNNLSSGIRQLLYNNGRPVTSNEEYSGNFKNLSNQGYRLGDAFYWTNVVGYAPFNGRIAELISYATPLSNAQRRDVETYLAIKYGITLDINTQNYTVYGVSIYENKSYAKDIAGIGKHLATQGLNQTASKSVNQGALIKMSNPSNLDNGEYLVWGDDGGAVSWVQTSVPAGNVDRLERTWYVRKTGNPGTVDVSINLNQLGIDIDNSTVNLFQAPAGASVPNAFSTATAHTNGVRSVNSEGQTLVTFQGINFGNGEYFTIGGDIQTTSPGGVKDNLSAWYKADGGVSLSGTSVKRWSDYSGNANDVYQGNTSLQPGYLSNQINFNPAISFSNDYLDGIDGFYTQDYFVVARPGSTVNRTNAYGALLGFESGANSALVLGPHTGSFANEVVTHQTSSGYAAAINSNTRTFNPPLIINAKNNASVNQQELWIDGISETVASVNTGSFTNLSNTELRIGSAFNGLPYAGDIAEVISYSSRLSNTQRRDVETYLAIKYGITLNISAQSYTARGSNIYNYTTHPNHIAGIARDLDMGYNQLRSRSSHAGDVIEMSNASSMGNGDFLVWGKDGASASVIQTTELPAEYDERIGAEYRVAVTGTPGTVTVKVYVGGLPQYSRRSQTANFYSLLINNTGNFTAVSQVVAASGFSGDTLVFNNVSFSNGNYFTLAVPPIPTIGVNNSLWLRADKGITSSGVQVTGWADQSGLNNHASPAATGPSLVNNAVNSNPALTFNGNTIQGTAGFYTREYFVMAAPDITYSSASGPGFLVGFEAGQTSGLTLGSSVANWTDEVLTHLYRGSGHRTALRGATTYNSSTIFNSRNNNGATPQALFTNGTNLTTSLGSTFTNLNNQAYRLGNSFTSAGAFNGKISEVLSFSTTQTNAEKRNVETYLALKYGVTLATTGGNYTMGGTTVYNVTTFSGFTSNVVGIAAYARYDFLQTASGSVNPDAYLSISQPGSFQNNDFLVMGDDGAAMASTNAGIPALVGERVQRKWAVQSTNTPGTVTLTFYLNGLGYGAKMVTDFSLILDNNSNFTDGITRMLTPTAWSGQTLTFTGVDLSGINYLGLGTAIDLLSDSDTDGIPNYFEIAYGTDPNDGNGPVVGGSPYKDTNGGTGMNGDGISDALEQILINNGATGPLTRYTDTDGDGIPDWIEVKNGTNPFNANSPTTNGDGDADGDGFPNALEILVAANGGTSNVSFTTDTDGDGVPDFLEIINGTDPGNPNQPVASGGTDTDGDGVSNAMEAILIAGGATGGVNKESDTDEDGIPDYIEAITYTDPFNGLSPLMPSHLSIRVSNADFSVSGNACVDIKGHQWIHVLDQSGRLVFSINPVGNNLGATCYGVRILSGIGNIRSSGLQYVLNRNWWISPTNQPTGEKAYIRFYLKGQEMLDFWTKAVGLGIINNATSEDLFNRDHVRMTKIGNINTLDPLVNGGNRSLLSPKLLSFDSNDRMFTVGTSSFSSFIPHTTANDVTLPITLLDFSGRAKKAGVELSWSTASEQNNAYFEIQRSGDGREFETIGQVKGAGNSRQKLQYEYFDHSPLVGLAYYRLRQVDLDHQASYSQKIHVTVAGEGLSAKLYPNPTDGLIHLRFGTELSNRLPQVTVYDLSGRRCSSQLKPDGANEVLLDVSGLSAGTYLVEIITGANREIKMVIKE
jgi:hypothetical protein